MYFIIYAIFYLADYYLSTLSTMLLPSSVSINQNPTGIFSFMIHEYLYFPLVTQQHLKTIEISYLKIAAD